MATKKPIRIADVLQKPGSGLARLARRAASMADLAESLKSALPEPLARHVLSVNHRAHTLVVLVDSPAWATRLRYLEGEIRSRLAADQGIGIEKLVVRVAPR